MQHPDPAAVEVIAPNLKRRLSGVTATVVRLVPVQARTMEVAVLGPGLPDHLPRITWGQAMRPARGPRVWHARRNTEMLAGLALRRVLGRRLRLLFTSAAQRRHTAYTRGLIARMDAVVATSAAAAEHLERPARVIPHGVDVAAFAPGDRAALRARAGLPHGVWVGCFGRVRAQKGTDVLVDALVRLMPARPALRCLIVGREDDAAFAAALRGRIAAAGLGGRFRWEADLSWGDLAERHAAMDVHAAPQRWEGFGLTPLEAMASGVPVVATTVGAFPDLIVPEVGALVRPADPAAFAAALAPLVDEAPRRGAMGRAARAHVVAHHAIEREAAALEEVYRALLARDRGA